MPETFFSGSGSLFSVVEFKELREGDFLSNPLQAEGVYS